METSRDWLDYATLMLAALGFIGAAVAIFFSARANTHSKKANKIAQESNDIAERALGHTTKYVPPWRIEWAAGDTFRLMNSGSDTEYDVEFEVPGAFRVDTNGRIDQIHAQSSANFLIAFGMGGSREATVTWARQPSGARFTWTDEVPFKPRRPR